MRASPLALLCWLVVGCVAAGSETDKPLPAGAQTWSLTGEALYPPPLAADVEQQRQAQLEEAQADFEAEPNLDNAIWVGRREAYLGHYREAIDTYTEALREHPDAPELYRHRGHRYITLRGFDAAIADLERATELVAGTQDVIEADGQPNERNIPMSTLQRNIWYHLGLAYYLKGDLEEAARSYRECIALSATPDALVSPSHWLYVILRRLERDDEAAAVLEPIHADLDIVENQNYLNLLLMYRGERQPEDLLSDEDSVTNATTAYGVGAWFLYNGNRERAREVFESIVAREQWGAFGYIAAAADLQRW